MTTSRRIASFALVLALFLALCACGSPNAGPSPSPGDILENTDGPPDTAKEAPHEFPSDEPSSPSEEPAEESPLPGRLTSKEPSEESAPPSRQPAGRPDGSASGGMSTEQDIWDTLSVREQRELNTFLSNFSEVGFYRYSSDDPLDMPDPFLLSFATLHIYYNQYQKITFRDYMDMGTCYMILLSDIKAQIERFFHGAKMTDALVRLYAESSYGTFFIDDSYVACPAFDGTIMTFTQVNALYQADDGTSRAQCDVYYLQDYFFDSPGLSIDDCYAPMSSWRFDYPVDYGYPVEAVVVKARIGNMDTYRLVRYEEQ